MINKRTGFISKIAKYLPMAEIICLAVLMLGIVIAMTTNDITFVFIPMNLLAMVYFLNAYVPPAEPEEGGQFTDLLGKVIVPKVLWIACSVVTIGLMFFVLSFDPETYKQILIIGVTSIGGALTVLAFLLFSGVKGLHVVVPLLYRAVPLAIFAIYILMI